MMDLKLTHKPKTICDQKEFIGVIDLCLNTFNETTVRTTHIVVLACQPVANNTGKDIGW